MSELKPGRELDALVAEKVMKWHKFVQKGMYWEPCGVCGEREIHGDLHAMRDYSTSIEAAWEVLNKFPRWTLERNGKGKYICLIPAERIFLYVSSTAPMAICLAALNASGHVFEESKK